MNNEEKIISEFIRELVKMETQQVSSIVKDSDAQIVDRIIKKFQEIIDKYADK